MNYIKRLIGKPGETIAVHNGDLYILSPERGLKYDDIKDVTDPDKRKWEEKQLWEKVHQHQDDPQAIRLFESGAFVILRKAPENILAMKRIVYDNDHPAKDLLTTQPPRWSDRDKTAVWAADKDNGFRVAPADDQVHWLSYHHILRDHGDKPQLITDFMGYNTWEPHPLPGENWVGDLILECEAQLDKAQGEVTLELSKGPDRFRARFDLGNGFCKLLHVDKDDKETELDGKPTGCKGGGTHRLRFANVDQRLTVWVDDALPFGDGVVIAPPATEGPDKKNDLEPASVGLRGSGATLKHVKLWRDTYYTTQHNNNSPSTADAGNATIDFSDPDTWAPLRKLPVKTMYVQPGHYLCMGDNSPESSDGRSWGLVPQRLLLGKALLVYYPFNRFGHIR
jgi:signal peptidase I